VLSVVLVFLKRCEDESFNNLVNTNRSGTIQSPSHWINLLQKATLQEPSCRLQIAENICPLVKCMCNDMTRLFFKSNKHWKEAMLSFVGLIYNMIHSCTADNSDKKIVYALIQNEGLLRSIIQWGYWGQHRSDISKELRLLDVDMCKDIARMGRDAIATLIIDTDNFLRGEDGEWTEDSEAFLLMCGTTPIVSKDYDPSCMVSYAVQLIRHIKAEGWSQEEIDILDYLVGQGDCVDKDVVNGMIDLGLNYCADEFEYATFVVAVSNDMVKTWIENGNSDASDTRVAFAIRAGLVEMCLDFIGRFGDHESFCIDDVYKLSFFSYIESIFECIHTVSLHQKTAKAIRSKRNDIEEKLLHMDEKNDGTSNNLICKKLFDMVRSILNINGSYCCRCNKSLSKTEVKQCNGCGRMSYCSRACQREDWLNGHKLTCNKPYKYDHIGHFQGRFEPELPNNERDARKMKELETNINMIQLKLFLDNSETILSQAKALNLPLYDCVVDFDLCKCPSTVRVVDYREDFNVAEERKGFENSRSKDNITCDFYSRLITDNGEYDEDGDIPRLSIQRLFPHEWLRKKSKSGPM